jgi:hypothetical protein
MNKKIFSKSNIVLITNKDKSEIKYILDDVKKAKIYKIIELTNKNSPIIPFLKGDENTFFEKIKYLIENRKIDEIIYIDSKFSEEEKFELWELTRIF